MPGSKTYTTNKVNELLEFDFFEGINEIEKNRSKNISSAISEEIIKICISLYVSTYTGVFSSTENAADSVYNLKVMSKCILIFVIIYIVATVSWKVLKWIFDAIFNKRLLLGEKKKAYISFHKRIINHIYLGISFENKYNEYITKTSNRKNDLNLDLASNYLSQSVHYFKVAKSELFELIPTKAGRSAFREKLNAKYLDYIGYPLIFTSLITAQRSLNRLLNSQNNINQYKANIDSENNNSTIRNAYKKSIDDLFHDINTYTSDYQALLERVISLEKTAKM